MLKSAGNVKQCSKFEKVPSAIGAGLGMVERRLCKFGLSLRGNFAHLSDAKLDSIVRDVIQQTFQTLAAKLVTENSLLSVMPNCMLPCQNTKINDI